MESSSFNNGGSQTSFLSLLMADDAMLHNRDEFDQFLPKDELPPLPPSLDTTPANFLSLTNHHHYFPSVTSTAFNGGFQTLKIEQPSLLTSSSSSPPAPAFMKQEFATNTLPELHSLENLTAPQTNEEDNFYSVHQSKKRKKNTPHRQRMSERMYSLEKLLPAPGIHRRRLSSAEVLEEALKYIAFLKAQVAALRSMPSESSIAVAGKPTAASAVEALGRLSRQQVLQVVVNSAAAQSLMAEKGWCLVAAEQVLMMKKIEARKKLIQQLLNHLPL